MAADLSVTFTGLRFQNPFLLSSAPPTESESNILRAFEAGWGGVVTKTIGLHPVVNVAGPKTKLRRSHPSGVLSVNKGRGCALHSSWKWALISDDAVDSVLPRGGRGDAVVSSNAFPSLPLIDPESLEFEMNVDGLVSSGGLGGPAILPLSMAKMAQMTRAFPEKSFSGIGGISEFSHALNYFLLGCGTVQVCTAAMLDHAVGPNVVKRLVQGMGE